MPRGGGPGCCFLTGASPHAPRPPPLPLRPLRAVFGAAGGGAGAGAGSAQPAGRRERVAGDRRGDGRLRGGAVWAGAGRVARGAQGRVHGAGADAVCGAGAAAALDAGAHRVHAQVNGGGWGGRGAAAGSGLGGVEATCFGQRRREGCREGERERTNSERRLPPHPPAACLPACPACRTARRRWRWSRASSGAPSATRRSTPPCSAPSSRASSPSSLKTWCDRLRA